MLQFSLPPYRCCHMNIGWQGVYSYLVLAICHDGRFISHHYSSSFLPFSCVSYYFHKNPSHFSNRMISQYRYCRSVDEWFKIYIITWYHLWENIEIMADNSIELILNNLTFWKFAISSSHNHRRILLQLFQGEFLIYYSWMN